MVRFQYLGTTLRWIGWAVIWINGHQELRTMSSWVNTPDVVVTSVALYIISGLMIELIYRKLVWGEINPERNNGRDPQPDTAIHEWTSFQESDPPDGKPIQVRCADGVVRIAKAYGMKDGRLLFDITFEVDVTKESQENQMKFRPTHWRKTQSNVTDELNRNG